MTLNPPRCAANMEQRLAALRRDQEIDGLRAYLIKYNLFPRNRDPHNSPIRVEELKELVKHWKLHRTRGFWRDHPDKEDLVRALLQHIKSEAANKQRRQDAQDKYRKAAAAPGVPPGTADPAKLREFAAILNGGNSSGSTSRGDAGEPSERELAVAAARRRNFGGGDLFYQRGDYDEGMIYLSRIDKARFQSETHNPCADLLTAAAGAPTPLDRLLLASPVKEATTTTAATAVEATSLLHQVLEQASHNSVPGAALLTRETRLKCVEGLYRLSCLPGFEATVLREGALPTLAAAVKGDDAAVRLLAAAAILNLATPPSSSSAKPSLEASPHQQQHQAPMSPHGPHAATLLPAATRELFAKLVDDGVVPALLELAHTPHAAVKALSARALLRLTLDEAHHFALVHDGAVVALSQLLASAAGSDDAHRRVCVLALVNLAGVPRAVTCDAVLAALTSLARSGGAETQRLCAQALLNLSILPTTRPSLVDEGAVAALALLAATRRLPVLSVVSCVLGNLAGVRTNQEALVKSGALPVALDVLHALERADAQITEGEGDEDEGAEPDREQQEPLEDAAALVAQVRHNCAGVVANLCCNPKLQARVGAAGVVPALLRVLQRVRLDPDRSRSRVDGETEKLAVLALANLALEDRCRPGLVADGAVPPLLAVLREPEDERDGERDGERDDERRLLRLDCVTALSNLMLHPLNFRRLVDEGVVPAFLAPLQAAPRAASDDMQRACVFALLTLARDPGMQTRLADAALDADRGAIPTMLGFLSRKLADAELCGAGVAFLRHLASRAENRAVLFAEGSVALLVRVLLKRAAQEPVAAIYAAWADAAAALAHLAACGERKAALASDGVLEAVAHVLRAMGADTRARTAAVERHVVQTQLSIATVLFELRALCGAADDGDGAAAPAFLSSLLLATQATAKRARLSKKTVALQQRAALTCALTVAHVALLMPRGLRRLAGVAELPAALTLAMRSGLHEAQVCAAVALCNLAAERAWPRPTTEDFIVVALLRLNSDATKVVCARALFNLLAHDSSRHRTVESGALYALLQLARLESDAIRDLALRAVYNLSLDAAAAARLLDMELVRVLAHMYQPEFSRAVKRLVCGILANLSSLPVTDRRAIQDSQDADEDADDEARDARARQLVDEGALGVLRQLVKVRDPETKVYAVNVLHNLSCSAELGDRLARDESGVLHTLLAELRADNKEVARFAAAAVANLSSSSVAVQLLTEQGSSGSVAAVTVLNDAMKRALATSDAQFAALATPTLAACVLALRNLFSRPENQRRLVESGGVATLAAVLASPGMAQESATLAAATDMLCLLATRDDQPPEYEARLVADGVVRALLAIARSSVGTGGALSPADEARASLRLMAALSNLSRLAASHDAMLKDGALDAVVELSRTNASDPRAPFKGLVAVRGEEFAMHAMVVLRNLSRVDPAAAGTGAEDLRAQRLAAQPAVVPVVLALSTAADRGTREHVIIALHNLARRRRSRMQLFKHDGVKALLRLAASAITPLKRHVCSLALQSLAAPPDEGDGIDPHAYKVAQEGVVAAIAALGDQHQPEVLAAAAASVSAVVAAPRLAANASKPEELALVRAGGRAIVQKGAPPDWERVLITDLSAWPELSALTARVNDEASKAATARSRTDADVEADEHVDDGSDDEEGGTARSPLAGARRAKDATASTTASPVNRTAVTVPRTCSTDVVLGALQLLSDGSADKVHVNVEAELAQRRAAAASNAAVSPLTGEGEDESELPKLRPATAPESEDAQQPAAMTPIAHQRAGRHSTLKQARLGAIDMNTGTVAASRNSISSPVRSPAGTKRWSRTLEPLTLGASASAPAIGRSDS